MLCWCDPAEGTAGLCHQHTTPGWCSWLVLLPLQPSSTYLMIWIVVDCVSLLAILWAFLLVKYV